MYILVVEDDPKVADFIRKGLSEQGNRVEIAHDGLSGHKMIFGNNYDLVILDVLLPGVNGLELCRQIKKYKEDLPVLLLSALGSTQDKVMGLESGADDYLVKPFHFDELIARISVLRRRSLRLAPTFSYRVANLEVDAYRRIVRRDDKTIVLTSTEFSLLELLIAHQGKVLSRAFISASIWGINFDRGTNVVAVYINYLRVKIDKGFSPPLIYTVVNEGYMLGEP